MDLRTGYAYWMVMLCVIAATMVITILVLILLQNFTTPAKSLERKVEHRYAVSDSQLRRELSTVAHNKTTHQITALIQAG